MRPVKEKSLPNPALRHKSNVAPGSTAKDRIDDGEEYLQRKTARQTAYRKETATSVAIINYTLSDCPLTLLAVIFQK